MRAARHLRILASTLVVLSIAAPLTAYTVVLRDGTSIIALEPYSTRGDLAIVTLPSGAQTSFPLAEVDIAETNEVNRLGVRRGFFLNRRELQVVADTPSPTEKVDAFKEFVRQNPSMDALARRQPVGRQMQQTLAGNLNLFTLSRIDPAPEVGGFIEEQLNERGLRFFRVLAGSLPTRILVDVTTANQSEVFKAMRATAEALIATRREHAGVDEIELILSTSNGSRAGQFVLTPTGARTLLDERGSIVEFYLNHVQF